MAIRPGMTKILLRRLEDEARLRRQLTDAQANALLNEWLPGATLDELWTATMEYRTSGRASCTIIRSEPAGFVIHKT